MCLSLGCYSNIPSTGWLINNRRLFLTSGDWKIQNEGQQIWYLVRACFLVSRWLSSCVLTWQRGERALWDLS